MARRRVLADTSLFIEQIRTKDKTATTLYRLGLGFDIETSAVVAAEFLYGTRRQDAIEEGLEMFAEIVVHPFTLEMAARQTEILPSLIRQNRVPDIRDLMIAATALELDLPLATLNRSHFEAIPNLVLIP